jgi:acetoacetate decarboxylase
VPTLVEVKRSGDTRARREVVAQMLEVAADLVESSFVIAAAVTNVGDARSGIVITCDGEPGAVLVAMLIVSRPTIPAESSAGAPGAGRGDHPRWALSAS